MNAQTIVDVLSGVTKKWAKQRKAEERRRSAQANRWAALAPRDRTTIKLEGGDELVDEDIAALLERLDGEAVLEV